MRLEEAKQKAEKVQFLVDRSIYKPSNKKLIEIIVAPVNRVALKGFITEKFRSGISNDDLLKQCSVSDFMVYGIFESETPYDIHPFEIIVEENQGHPDFTDIYPLAY